MITLLTLASALAAASLTSTPTAEHKLEVAVYDTVRLGPSAIATLQATVDAVLEPASITVSWTLCSDPSPQNVDCSPPRPRDVVIRVLATHAPRGRGRCGFAVPHDPGRGFISLAVDCATQAAGALRGNWKLAHTTPVTDAHILGYMLAHEIAHLLLADTPHASVGLFKRRLARPDWTDIEHGRLTFGPQDIQRMRAVARQLSSR